MPMVLSYHVLDGISGKWLDGDEHSWTTSFIDSATFTDAKLAQDIAERELSHRQNPMFYVMACLGLQ